MFDPHDFDEFGYPEPPYPERYLPLWKLIALIVAGILLWVPIMIGLDWVGLVDVF